MKHLEENVREKLHNIGFDNDFRYDIEGRGNERKKRINWTTSKKFFNDTINRLKNNL